MSDNIIQRNEDLIKHDLKDLVRNSVEETLNSLLSFASTSSAVYVLPDLKDSIPFVSSASNSARLMPPIAVGLAEGKVMHNGGKQESKRKKLTDMLLDDKITKEAYDVKYKDLTRKINQIKW